jgi:Peptidase_C39 like family
MSMVSQYSSESDVCVTIARDVPYFSQYASPELIYQYIHENLLGLQDPRWREFGTEDVEEYNFWSRRSCGIACLKMGITSLTLPAKQPAMMDLVRQGIDLGGYIVHNEQGEFVDMGWYYQPLVELGQSYGIKGKVCRHLTIDEICAYIAEGSLVVASVSPEIGEREDTPITYRAGHLVLIYGYAWSQDQSRPHSFLLHNPSGRFPETQAGAHISLERFSLAFAQRGFVLSPTDENV